nr:hypothetical protein [Tanacetum cinerariifolium]
MILITRSIRSPMPLATTRRHPPPSWSPHHSSPIATATIMAATPLLPPRHHLYHVEGRMLRVRTSSRASNVFQGISKHEEPMEDQPLPAEASPTALSSGYVVDFELEKDGKDPKEDPAYYPADRGNNDDDESSNDNDDDDDVLEG